MYSGSYSFITETLVRFNVSADFVDVDKEKDFVGAVQAAVKKNTKVSLETSWRLGKTPAPNLALESLDNIRTHALICHLVMQDVLCSNSNFQVIALSLMPFINPQVFFVSN